METTPPQRDPGEYFPFGAALRQPVLHVVFAFFAITTLYLTYQHTPWRDEAQAWLMARSLSVWGLFLEARHDGHPILWHLCLKAIQTAGIGYPGMMVLNWLFTTIAIGLLLYRSPLPLLAKLIVALSPIVLLHLSYNARNYAISAALAFLAATLYRTVEKKPVAFCVVLALLANTNVFAAAAFVGMSFQFLLEQGFSFGRARFSLRPIFIRYLAANAILAAGAFLLAAQLAPVHIPGEITTTIHKDLPPTEADPTWNIFLTMGCCVALVIFPKSPGCPRIFGGILSAVLAFIPFMEYRMAARHCFMLEVEVIYFVWIYYDDILRQANGTTFFRIPRSIAVTLLVLTATVACSTTGIRNAFRRDSDSTSAAEAVIQQNLDRPDTLFFRGQPNLGKRVDAAF